MYCPQCGQQQASSEMRFCSRCGFPLGGVVHLLAQGGALPTNTTSQQGRELSPRQLGTRQGAMMMFSTLLVVPIISLISVFIVGWEELLIPLAALITFVGGLLRIIYARLYEDDTPGVKQDAPAYVSSPSPAQLSTGLRGSALPPPQSAPVPNFVPRRANTAELVPPPSITENTTKLLDEDKYTHSE
jgi:hypothetical protein